MADSIAPSWRESRGPSVLSDVDVLEKIDEDGIASIRQISEDRISKSQLRLQCRYLQKMGLLNRKGNELYSLTTKGEEFIQGQIEIPQSEGYFDLQKLLDLSDRRITDLSLLTQEDIKQRNYEIFRRAKKPETEIDHEYSVNVMDSRRKQRKVLSAKNGNWIEYFVSFLSQNQSRHNVLTGSHLFHHFICSQMPIIERR